MKTTEIITEEEQRFILEAKALEIEIAKKQDVIDKANLQAKREKKTLDTDDNQYMLTTQLMESFSTEVGDLKYDRDFLWFIISLLMTKDFSVYRQQLDRANRSGLNSDPNRYTSGQIKAYKRAHGLK